MLGAISTRLVATKLAPTAHRATFATSSTRSSDQKLPVGMKVSPYALFVKQNFKKDADTAASDVMKELSSKWKELTLAEKEKYTKISKEEFEKKVKEFLKLSNEEQEKLVNQAKEKKADRAHRKELKEKREQRKSSGRPAPPASAYALYIKEKVLGSGKDCREAMKKAVAEWKTLTDNQKTKFTTEAAKLKQEYQEQLAKWEAEKEKKEKQGHH